MSDNCEVGCSEGPSGRSLFHEILPPMCSTRECLKVAPLRAHQILKHHLDLRSQPTQSSSDPDSTENHLPLNLVHLNIPNTSFVHELQSDLLMNPGSDSLLCEDEHHRDLFGSTATSMPTVEESDLSRPRNLPSLSTLDVLSSFRCRSQDPSEETVGPDWLPKSIDLPDSSCSESCNVCQGLPCTHDADEAGSESDNEAQSIDYLDHVLVEETINESRRSTESHCHTQTPNRSAHYLAVEKVAPGPLTMILFEDRVIYDSQKQPGRARTRLSFKRPLNSRGCDDFAKRLKISSKVTSH